MANIVEQQDNEDTDFADINDFAPVVEQKPQEPEVKPEVADEDDDLPEKYRGKSAKEIARMHQEAEKLIGRQANEVHEVRSLADQLIKQQLEKAQKPATQEVPQEVDFYDNPHQAVAKAVETHPDVVKAREAAAVVARMQFKEQLAAKHPDFQELVNDNGFAEWVKSSPYRLQQYAQADTNSDLAAADDLLSTYKQLRQIQKAQAVDAGKEVREKQLKAATVDGGGTGETPRKIYRRADIIRLQITDPKRYADLQPEIMQAYAEGRVK